MGAPKILIVDDEKEYVDVLTERLDIRGLDVTGALSGEEALSVLGRQPVDVVLLDVMMPGMDGIETLVEIRKRHPGISVIMLSGHAQMETAVKGMELGACDYLVKPVDFNELFYKIEDACNSLI